MYIYIYIYRVKAGGSPERNYFVSKWILKRKHISRAAAPAQPMLKQLFQKAFVDVKLKKV